MFTVTGTGAGRKTAVVTFLCMLALAIEAIYSLPATKASPPTSTIARLNGVGDEATNKASGLFAFAGPPEVASPGDVRTPNTDTIGFSMGSPQSVFGPSWWVDNAFHTRTTPLGTMGYISNAQSWLFSWPNMVYQNVISIESGPGLKYFDGNGAGGAWLASTYVDPSDNTRVSGWYHAEQSFPQGNRKSVAYAFSTDGGRTYQKPNYPNNQVLRAPPRFLDPTEGSEGDPHVIRVGNYFYMYFVAAWDMYKIHLARSLVMDGGMPRTWWKYYNGSFSQPGLGGESTAIASAYVLGRTWVSWNTSIQKYMGFSWSPTGFGISTSTDGMNWQQATGDVLFTTHQFWERDSSSPELIEYPSFISLTSGNPDTQGEDMWLYYMEIPAGQTAYGNTRYLVKRQVHTTPAP